MGKKNKLQKFEDLKSLDNVLEFPKNIKGKWNETFFQNNNPITLELACGKGDYTIALSELYPDKNFIGVDIKGSRIWSGAKQSFDEKLNNVAFLRIRIGMICKCFSKKEIDEVWITFPDPQLKRRRARKRLTHPKFLRKYNVILKENGKIHLKTDSQFLHGFTLGIIAGENHSLEDSTVDLYNSEVRRKHMDIKTFYESKFLKQGMPITYLRFSLNYKD